MIGQELESVLVGAAAITAICGTRIYPLAIPTNPTLPAINYKIIGGQTAATVDTAGNQRSRVEINCWGTKYGDAVTLRAAVIAALTGYSSASITSIRPIQPRDDFDDALLQYIATIEFYVTYPF